MSAAGALPPGQFETRAFVRFGLGRFVGYDGPLGNADEVAVRGDVETPFALGDALAGLERIRMRADLHCVTSWSRRDIAWEGVRFADFHARIVAPRARPAADASLVVLRAADGYATSLPLADALAPDVLLADAINGAPLEREHGAPLRFVAPAHYGYKNVKHLAAIEFWRDARAYRFPRPYPSFIDHPRARVALEERGVGVPAWALRAVYRLMIPKAIRRARVG
jgi:DMSO/TMAO reductase YedYZ molybdopterin-dependent catalytic subunit